MVSFRFALALHPESALPVLKATRDSMDNDDQRWWIDAAIQQIEREQSGRQKPNIAPN